MLTVATEAEAELVELVNIVIVVLASTGAAVVVASDVVADVSGWVTVVSAVVVATYVVVGAVVE
jgi:hypothetical protein